MTEVNWNRPQPEKKAEKKMPKKPQSRFGKFMADLGETIEESNRRERERRIEEKARLDARYALELERAQKAQEVMDECTEIVQAALRNYEEQVGRPYIMDSGLRAPRMAEKSAMMHEGPCWDTTRKGHLVSCPDNCRIRRHCEKCGDEVFGVGIFCGNCRP